MRDILKTIGIFFAINVIGYIGFLLITDQFGHDHRNEQNSIVAASIAKNLERFYNDYNQLPDLPGLRPPNGEPMDEDRKSVV